MNIFTKRNAIVGFATLKALKRMRGRKRRSRTRIALTVTAGVVSLGALAAIAVLLLRRQHAGPDEVAAPETEDDIVGEVVTANTEPIPAT